MSRLEVFLRKPCLRTDLHDVSWAEKGGSTPVPRRAQNGTGLIPCLSFLTCMHKKPCDSYTHGVIVCVCVYVAVIFHSLSRVDSLRSHELHHSRLPCPSPSPGVCSNSCPVIPSNHLILCWPLLLLPSIFPIRVFSNESAVCIHGLPRWLSGKDSILAWEIPWTGEPGGLQSMGLQRVRHGLAAKQQ